MALLTAKVLQIRTEKCVYFNVGSFTMSDTSEVSEDIFSLFYLPPPKKKI